MYLREAICKASEHFLTRPLTQDWPEWSHSKVLMFVDMAKADIVNCRSAPEIYKAIENLAEEFMEVANGTPN